jgi:hypothetical protein
MGTSIFSGKVGRLLGVCVLVNGKLDNDSVMWTCGHGTQYRGGCLGNRLGKSTSFDIQRPESHYLLRNTGVDKHHKRLTLEQAVRARSETLGL